MGSAASAARIKRICITAVPERGETTVAHGGRQKASRTGLRDTALCRDRSLSGILVPGGRSSDRIWRGNSSNTASVTRGVMDGSSPFKSAAVCRRASGG